MKIEWFIIGNIQKSWNKTVLCYKKLNIIVGAACGWNKLHLNMSIT